MMRAHSKYHLSIALIIAIPLIGYGIMHLLVYVVPVSEDNVFSNFFYTAIVIVLGLGIPYAMLKLLFHAANLKNRREKPLRLQDIPKDKDQLAG